MHAKKWPASRQSADDGGGGGWMDSPAKVAALRVLRLFLTLSPHTPLSTPYR